MEQVPVADMVAGSMVRGRGISDGPPLKGIVGYELVRGGKILVPRIIVPNAVTNTAKNRMLDGWFNAGTIETNTTWSIGLVDGTTYTSFQPTDTMSSHTGWQEFTDYTVGGVGTNRGLWSQGAASGQAVTNVSPVTYDFTGITGTATIQGIFVVSNITKNSTANLLWSTASFLSPLSVENGDQLRVTYTVQL